MELLTLGTNNFHQLHYSLFQQPLLLRVRVLRGRVAIKTERVRGRFQRVRGPYHHAFQRERSDLGTRGRGFYHRRGGVVLPCMRDGVCFVRIQATQSHTMHVIKRIYNYDKHLLYPLYHI